MSRRRPSGNWFEYSVIFQSGATYVGMRDSAATMISTRLRTSRRISKNSFALSTMLFIDFSFLTRSARHGIPQPYAHASVLAVEQAAEKEFTLCVHCGHPPAIEDSIWRAGCAIFCPPRLVLLRWAGAGE